jgi:hypothetical protein
LDVSLELESYFPAAERLNESEALAHLGLLVDRDNTLSEKNRREGLILQGAGHR